MQWHQRLLSNRRLLTLSFGSMPDSKADSIMRPLPRRRALSQRRLSFLRQAIPLFIFCIVVNSASAEVCEPYIECCTGYVVALEEAGTPAVIIKQVAESCDIPHHIAPGNERNYFCQHAWEAISARIARQYSRGIIGFYPQGCAIDPVDPSLDPEVDIQPRLDPESDSTEALENLELLEER